MTAFQLKMLAIICMVLDHVAKGFFVASPDHPVSQLMQFLGRITFPIFAFAIAEGYQKTRNLKRYMLRLLLFAFIAQVPYHLYLNYTLDFSDLFFRFNVIFTLLVGLIAIELYEKADTPWMGIVMVIAVWCGTNLFPFEYNIICIFTVFFFYLYRNHFTKMVVSQSLLFLFYQVILIANGVWNWIQLGMFLSLLVIYFYQGKQGPRAKYLFYIFYPGHFFLLFVIKWLFDFPLE